MKNTTLIVSVGIAALLVGLFAGSVFASKKYAYKEKGQNGMHRMADGQMMDDRTMSMETMMRDMQASLAGKTGKEFDQAFLQEMIVHHQGAVLMAQAALERAESEDIKNLSRAIIEAQNKEIAQMQSWQTQ